MTEEETKALDYGERLLNVAIDVVGTARIEPQSARDPKVIALTLLCRSISNFRAAMLLAQQAHVLESRVLNRCLYENLLWIGALRERGSEFVRELIDDDAHNRQALAQITLKLSSLHGRDVDDEDGMFLRNIIKQIAERFPNLKKLHADKAAAQSSVHSAYIEYLRLSLDSVHCLEPDSELYVADVGFGSVSRLSMTHIIASLAKPSAMTANAS